jgi:hypothetical protein
MSGCSACRNLARQKLDLVLGVLEREVVRVHALDRHPAGLDQPDRRRVRRRGDAERAQEVELLHDDQVAHEVGDGLEAFHAGEDDARPERRIVECLGDRHGRVGRHLDDDVGAVPVRELPHPHARILVLDVDRVVGAERLRERELLGVAREAGHDDGVGAGGARRDDAREPSLARAEHEDDVAGPRVGQLDRPSKTRAERVEHGRRARRQVLPHRVHDRERIEVHVVGVGSPDARRARERHVAVPEEPAPAAADVVATGQAGAKCARTGSVPRPRRDRRRRRASAWPRGRRCA